MKLVTFIHFSIGFPTIFAVVKDIILDDIHPSVLSKILPHLDNPTKMILGQASRNFKALTLPENTAFKLKTNQKLSLWCGAEMFMKITKSGYSIFQNIFMETHRLNPRDIFKHEKHNQNILDEIQRHIKCLIGMSLYIQADIKYSHRRLDIIVPSYTLASNNDNLIGKYLDAIEEFVKEQGDFDIITLRGTYEKDYVPSHQFEKKVLSILSSANIKTFGFNSKIGSMLAFQSFCKASSIQELHLDDSFSKDINVLKNIASLVNLTELVAFLSIRSSPYEFVNTLRIKSIDTNKALLNRILRLENQLDSLKCRKDPIDLNALNQSQKQIKALDFKLHSNQIEEFKEIIQRNSNSLKSLHLTLSNDMSEVVNPLNPD